MEWQQLEYFVTVAKLEHMTRAAEALAISQPALSRSISKLEEELGVPLFDRQGRSIMLNRYGELFLYRVQRMRKEYEKAVLELQELNNPELGDVSLGFTYTWNEYCTRLDSCLSSETSPYPFSFHTKLLPFSVKTIAGG